ncbi:unnamed protein product [Rhizopus stolonifer]
MIIMSAGAATLNIGPSLPTCPKQSNLASFKNLRTGISPLVARSFGRNAPRDIPNFTNDDFMAMVNVVSAIDEENMSPKAAAKLHPLNLATSMNRFKSNVVEGIADLLVKLPFEPIAEKNQLGKIDVQTRYCDPLLLFMVTDTMRKVVLR